MDISTNWDHFLEMEADAIVELLELETRIKEDPDNQEIKEKIKALKAFFSPYSSDSVFQ